MCRLGDREAVVPLLSEQFLDVEKMFTLGQLCGSSPGDRSGAQNKIGTSNQTRINKWGWQGR